MYGVWAGGGRGLWAGPVSWLDRWFDWRLLRTWGARTVSFTARNHPQQVATRGALPTVDDRETPPELFDPLNERFGFTLDVAAAPHNAKCARFFTLQDDGLEQSWAGETVWCNPPYSDIRPWVAKAWTENVDARGIVMLLPANRTEQAWWQEWVEPYRDAETQVLVTEFMRGRQRFIQAGRDEIKPNERPPFGLVLLIWRSLTNGVDYGTLCERVACEHTFASHLSREGECDWCPCRQFLDPDYDDEPDARRPVA